MRRRGAGALLAACCVPLAVAGCGGEERTERCGSVDAIASDAPGDITATGVDCATARRVAERATVGGLDPGERPDGFDCSDVDTGDSGAAQRCTRGDAVVTWRVGPG